MTRYNAALALSWANLFEVWFRFTLWNTILDMFPGLGLPITANEHVYAFATGKYREKIPQSYWNSTGIPFGEIFLVA